ncbi:MAG: hypothetical protein GX423_05155 [Nitrospiraceae bacterium]|jgi:hypothetical protein|nr:hypothetical protein [Nitrospiraceae bacterium]
MSVRDMNGNPKIWEKLTWEDMSSEEQELWSALGWRQYTWNRNEAPASADKSWNDLTASEQNAARGLGFSPALWDSFEDE